MGEAKLYGYLNMVPDIINLAHAAYVCLDSLPDIGDSFLFSSPQWWKIGSVYPTLYEIKFLANRITLKQRVTQLLAD